MLLTVVFFTLTVILLGVLVIFSKSAVVPWMDEMIRVNPGVVNRAEWMAPPHVIAAVKRDYRAFYSYATATLPRGWTVYLRDLNRYLCDEMLKTQRESLDDRLRQNRIRIVDILRAAHQLEVRNFSQDGMRCILIDYQTERRLATYDYWHGERVHTQHIQDATLVYEMHYDERDGVWKIAKYIQTLPPGITQGSHLEIQLPEPLGRDC